MLITYRYCRLVKLVNSPVVKLVKLLLERNLEINQQSTGLLNEVFHLAYYNPFFVIMYWLLLKSIDSFLRATM